MINDADIINDDSYPLNNAKPYVLFCLGSPKLIVNILYADIKMTIVIVVFLKVQLYFILHFCFLINPLHTVHISHKNGLNKRFKAHYFKKWI